MSGALALVVGAAAGALLRHAVTLWAIDRFGARFPLGTLLVNLAGCFLLGFLLASPTLSSRARLLGATGFCGSLTTFSTFSYETLALLEQGRLTSAALNAFGSLAAGLGCVLLGAALARRLPG